MKIIIISDIRSKSESIIPYGLKLARHMESEVDIIHIIDSRSETVLPSSYADSKSFALGGEKFTYQDTLSREKNVVSLGLDKILSTEASKLRYPLKIKSIVEEGSVENKIRGYLETNNPSLFLISTHPDGHIFSNQQEMIDIIKNTGAICLFVPPGNRFSVFKNATLPADFTSENLNKFREVLFVLKPFNPQINAINILKNKNLNPGENEQTALRWQNIAAEIFHPSEVKVDIVSGNDYAEALIKHIENNDTDLIVLIPEEQSFLTSLFYKSRERLLLEKIKTPVLICF